jgi:hypothetical protein
VSTNLARKSLSLDFANVFRGVRNLIKYGIRTPEK